MHSSRMHTTHSSSCPGGLPQCMLGYTPPGCGPGDPPDVGLETSPGWWPGDPPRPDPSTSPLGVGVETLPLARTLNFPLDVGLET